MITGQIPPKKIRRISPLEAQKTLATKNQYSETEHTPLENANFHLRLAVAYAAAQDYRQASDAFTTAIKWAQQGENSMHVATAYRNRAWFYCDNYTNAFDVHCGLLDLVACYRINPEVGDNESVIKKFTQQHLHATAQFILRADCSFELRELVQAELIALSAAGYEDADSTTVELCQFYLSLSIVHNKLTLPDARFCDFMVRASKAQHLSASAFESVRMSLDIRQFTRGAIDYATHELLTQEGYAAARLFTLRGVSYLKFNLFSDALADFTAALDRIDNSSRARATAYMNRALAYSHDRQPTLAQVDFGRALQICRTFEFERHHPQLFAAILYARATYYIQQQNFDSAMSDVLEALELDPGSFYLEDILTALFQNFEIEYIVQTTSLACPPALRDHVITLLNTLASVADLSKAHTRCTLNLIKFYLNLLYTQLHINKDDYKAILEHTPADMMDEARTLLTTKVAEALQRDLEPGVFAADLAPPRRVTLQNANSVIDIYSRQLELSQDKAGKIRALDLCAVAYEMLGHYANAEKSYLAQLHLFDQNDDLQRATIYARLAGLYALMEDAEQALNSLIKSFSYKTQITQHHFEHMENLLVRYFFAMTELMLQPATPLKLRALIKNCLATSFRNEVIPSSPSVFDELRAFYQQLFVEQMEKHPGVPVTHNIIVQQARKKSLSVDAIALIENVIPDAAAAIGKRRQQHYQFQKLRRLDFFKQLPAVQQERPIAPMPGFAPRSR